MSNSQEPQVRQVDEAIELMLTRIDGHPQDIQKVLDCLLLFRSGLEARATTRPRIKHQPRTSLSLPNDGIYPIDE